MMESLPVLAWSFGGALVLMAVLWGVSVRLEDVSIVDLFWGIAFIVVAGVRGAVGGISGPGWLLLALVGVWGLRLSLYLAWRKRGHGEDSRYVEIRRKFSPGFWWKSLFIIFIFQAFLAWVVSLPVQLAPAGTLTLTAWTAGGLLLWTIGILFETVGDAQLYRFKQNPANKGRVLDTGLWRYTRHPNYFGDFCVWWGIYLVAVSLGAPFWTVVGPLTMSWLLIKFSGVPLLETSMRSRRPDYAEYVARTSSFFPWIPKDTAGASR